MAQKDVAKLYYFAGRGRAETTRWMLAANQMAFENVPTTTAEGLAVSISGVSSLVEM